ncbi:MAG: hypothetical protein EBV53_04760 [Proteobacteria bacterium]|nr:hypothetical protein [Pseudomonadota bacterium]
MVSRAGMVVNWIAEGGVSNVAMLAGAAVTLAWGAVRVEAGDLGLAPLMILLFLGVEVFRPIRELRQLRTRTFWQWPRRSESSISSTRARS